MGPHMPVGEFRLPHTIPPSRGSAARAAPTAEHTPGENTVSPQTQDRHQNFPPEPPNVIYRNVSRTPAEKTGLFK